MLSYCAEICSGPFLVAVDMRGLSLSTIDDRMLRMLMHGVETCYPNKLRKVLIVGLPLWIRMLFHVVKNWLDPKWRDGIEALTVMPGEDEDSATRVGAFIEQRRGVAAEAWPTT